MTHRDVTPRNILVTTDDTAKLADFGISRAAGDVTLTGAGPITGVPAYLAPEVAAGNVATPASDVFSLGATLYAAVEGVSPWGRGDDIRGVLRNATKGSVPPPNRAGPLADTMNAMMRRRPADRPTAAQAQRLLAAVATARPVEMPRSRARTRALLGVGCAVLVLAAGAVVFATLPDRTDPHPARGEQERTAAPTEQEQAAEAAARWIRPGSGVPSEYLDLVVEAGTMCGEPGVSPALVAAILGDESGFDPNLNDPVDEYGIARWTPRVLRPFLPVEQQSQVPTPPFPPETSIPAVGRYLCALGPRLAGVPGDPPLLLAAAYRTSADTVRRDDLPPEVEQDYLVRVSQNLERFMPPP